MMTRNIVFAVLMMSAVAAMAQENPPAPGFDIDGSDVRAVAVADRTMEAMGGRAAWDRVQCIGWTIFGRTHLWNRWKGDYRLEADTLLVIMNVNSGEGRVWSRGDEMQPGIDRDALLKRARSIWINDSYWFLMPYKLKDTGVTLSDEGERATADGRMADVLGLTFHGVGDTPDNRYEVFVDRETGLVSQWSFYRKHGDAEPAFTLPWTGWTRFGVILLATGRGGRADITGIRVSAGDESAAFAAP
jgi:hypothetical protein